ncbi:MAG: glutaredoxin family protein [Deltaproteobacteria bacterium]|nr:glutaredoxin family protein [Deltaproteobacteria bacterium]
MIHIDVYARKDCHLCKSNCLLCKDVRDVLINVRKDIHFGFKEIDITANEELLRRYKENIPLIFINGKKAFKFKVDEVELRKRLRKEIIRNTLLKKCRSKIKTLNK